MRNNIIVIDDVISKGYQTFIQKMNFSWNFLAQTTHVYEGSTDRATGFSCDILKREDKDDDDECDITPFVSGLIPLLCEAVGKVDKDLDILQIFRIRGGMFIKNQNDIPHQSHIDRNDFHYTMLYYVNDSDGPTKFYDHKDGEVVKMVDPKKGRAVLFTGDTYHASSSPRNHSNRIVLNYNFLI